MINTISNTFCEVETTSSKLWQVRFDLTHCYFSGVPLPEPITLDGNIRILRRGDQGDCWAAVAIEAEDDNALRKKEQAAAQTIAEIANLYALISGFSIHFEGGGSNNMNSLDELGTPPHVIGIAKIEVMYTEEHLRENQRQLMETWNKTKRIRSKVEARLRDRDSQFLRVALFYHYQSGLSTIPDEEAFVDAAIGLEALYNESSQDISYKLATRGALLLSCSGEQENHFQILKELYKKRNEIVHGTGGTIAYSDLAKIKELLRKSLMPCIALGLDRNKADIITLIDRAMIEPQIREELRKEITRRNDALWS